MKHKSIPLFLLMTLLAALIALPAQRAKGDDDVSPDFFYDALAPYGEWIDVGDYGSCWHPTNVDPDWAPYTDGYWAYTDAGWTWVSYEDFGGIVYHYGRWMRVEGEGWCWTPDYEWAPAWVSWRSNDDYVGWAPLPPEARWRGDVGFSVWVDSTYDIGPGYYSFCRYRDFGAPVLRGVIVNRNENFALIGRTRNITNITYSDFGNTRVVFNGGPNFAELRGVTARPIPALRLVQNSRFDPAQVRGAGGGKLIASRTVGNQLIVGAPLIAAPSDPNFFKGRTKRFIEPGKVTKGWSGVKDPAARDVLKQQIQAQTKGAKPETAHARPVAATELQVVPTQSNPKAIDPAGGKPRNRDERPAPAAVVTQPTQVPASPTGGQRAPQVVPFVEKPVTDAGKEQRKHGKPTPAAAVVPQPVVPTAPAVSGQVVPRVSTTSEKPVTGSGPDGRRPVNPGTEKNPDMRHEGGDPAARERAIAAQKEAAGAQQQIQREKEKEREAIVKQRPPEPAARVVPQAPQAQPQVQTQPRVMPHDDSHSKPPGSSPKKGDDKPGKDKDKDKEKSGN